MKNHILYIVTAVIFLSSFSSCKNEVSIQQLIEKGDLEQIKARKAKLEQEAEAKRKEIATLDAEIAKLDPQNIEYSLVTSITPHDTLFNHYVEVQGSVKTKNDNQIFPEMAGVMNRLYVQEGQYINKGTLIATVDDGGMRQQIAQQQVQLELAKTTYERQKRLWEQNIGSEIQYLEAKNNYEALQKGISAMEQQLRKVNVYAPFSGSVEEVITKQGQVVSPGATPIIRLVGLGSMYVEAEVPEQFLSTVNRGTKTIVELDAIDTEYESTVRRINSTINPESRSFIIEVGVPNNRLIKPNLIANIRINDYTSENAILIPVDVINEDAEGNEFVFVVDQQIDSEKNVVSVKKVDIETGESTEEGFIEVLSGIEAGQTLIAEGGKILEDGDEVQILDYQPKN